jgi:hypothetical protein
MAAYKIAHISLEQAQQIQDLEKELGVCALAMEPGLELAVLSEEDLQKVKELEGELGLNLVVYREC